jgi:hypothetical protein
MIKLSMSHHNPLKHHFNVISLVIWHVESEFTQNWACWIHFETLPKHLYAWEFWGQKLDQLAKEYSRLLLLESEARYHVRKTLKDFSKISNLSTASTEWVFNNRLSLCLNKICPFQRLFQACLNSNNKSPPTLKHSSAKNY